MLQDFKAFQEKVSDIFKHNQQAGERYIVINAENLLRNLCGKTNKSGLALCCEVLKRCMLPGDEILENRGRSLTVCFKLPR
jgi:hypothetical protein